MNIAYAVAVALMLAGPLLLAVALRRRFRAPWLLWSAGAVAFFLSQTYHLPLNNWLADVGLIGPFGPDAPNLLRTAAVLGLSAGLCEGVMRLLAFWWLNRRGLVERWSGAVMVGLGHGGLEAMILGAMTALSAAALLGLHGTDLSALNLPADQLAALQTQLAAFEGSPLRAALPVVERLLALALHVAVSLLVWLAFRRRNPLYAVAGILYHALLDGVLVYAAQFVTNPWLLEGIVLLLALPALALIGWSYRRLGAAEPPHEPPPLRAEWAVYLALLRKELLEQWRTRKVIVVLAVFLLFGLTSPLLARFVSEIIMSVPGAEQFAGLMPEPKAADAVTQYIENITQFGFILALLLTMGLIAGEKDRGTAAMTLSKPAPRWAFVLSKFDALALVFLPAILLAGLGAGFYTNLLFDPGLALGPFLLGNVLLWLWLLTMVAAVLLGSALGRTALTGAGLGLLFSVALLVGGAFPQAAGVLPGGLVSWAGQLGLPAAADALPTTGAWGALAGSLVVIAFCLVTAVGVIERQDV
jgi:ABC-2 type transport system permease protein